MPVEREFGVPFPGTILPPEEEALCEEHNFPVLRKPFLASDVMNQIRGRLMPFTGVVRSA